MGAWYVELDPGCTKYVVMKRGIRSDRVSFHVDYGTDPDAESVSDDDDAGGDDDDDGDDGDDDNNGGDGGGNAGAAEGDGDVVIAAGHAGNLGNAAAQGGVQGPPPPPDVPFAVWAFHVQQMLQAPSSCSTAVPEASRLHDILCIYIARPIPNHQQ